MKSLKIPKSKVSVLLLTKTKKYALHTLKVNILVESEECLNLKNIET